MSWLCVEQQAELEAKEVVLPLVHSHSQNAIRRTLVLDKLTHVYVTAYCVMFILIYIFFAVNNHTIWNSATRYETK